MPRTCTPSSTARAWRGWKSAARSVRTSNSPGAAELGAATCAAATTPVGAAPAAGAWMSLRPAAAVAVPAVAVAVPAVAVAVWVLASAAPASGARRMASSSASALEEA